MSAFMLVTLQFTVPPELLPLPLEPMMDPSMLLPELLPPLEPPLEPPEPPDPPPLELLVLKPLFDGLLEQAAATSTAQTPANNFTFALTMASRSPNGHAESVAAAASQARIPSKHCITFPYRPIFAAIRRRGAFPATALR